MSQVAKHVIFIGQVQGVGFRFTTLDIAHRYGLTGMVRNLMDGTVEMVAQGNASDVDRCIRDIQEAFTGYIRQTKIEEIPLNPQYKEFRIAF